jgi:hypothetical protein
MTITLTKGEAEHLRGLLYANAREGSYYGNADQYWNRHRHLLDKLSPKAPIPIADLSVFGAEPATGFEQ